MLSITYYVLSIASIYHYRHGELPRRTFFPRRYTISA